MLAALIVRTGPLIWGFISVFAVCGLIAIASPKSFTLLSRCSNQWVDTSKLAAVLDKRIDIDRYVLPFSRALGVAVILALVLVSWLYLHYVQHIG